jgi:RHS repeat-associated protein
VQVAATVNGVTTKYVGGFYEVEGTNVTKYYLAGMNRIAMRVNGVLNYLLQDHLGSTALVTDTMGNLVSEQRYKAWGETRYSSSAANTDYLYTGQREVADIGLYFYKARWYDSALGRFSQADTIVPGAGDPRAWDRYSYVKNSPVVYNDPSGHCELTCVLAIIGVGLILSQIPSDTPQTDPANWGNPYIQLVGLSFMGPVGDLLATSIDCIISGCDPNTAFPSAFVPGPSPSLVEHAASFADEAEVLVTKSDDLIKGISKYDNALNNLDNMNPKFKFSSISSEGSFMSWIQALEGKMNKDKNFALTETQTDALLEKANQLGIKVDTRDIFRGHSNPNWAGPHLHFGEGQFHIRIPNNYEVK